MNGASRLSATSTSCLSLTQQCVRGLLCGSLPTAETMTREPEWGLLQRELAKKKRRMALRQLVASMPTTLMRLTRCLLMSPLSVAQYLPADAKPFDVVIFDEASQITVWDAIGAVARGNQVVVVGDPKQLPPTSFFDRANEDYDDDVRRQRP
jgi:ATP-dependent exoDNAse (exonuclease V) alpha subunit